MTNKLPLLLTWIDFNPINYIPVITSIIKRGMKLVIHFQTSMVAQLNFGDEVISSQTLQGM